MGEEASVEKKDQFLIVEERINHILSKDKGTKTSYSELRNFYSIVGNDIKGAITKRLARLMIEVLNFNNTYVVGKSSKKDHVGTSIENKFNDLLSKIPDINPQNTQAIFQFLREILPVFMQIKAHRAKSIKKEKKPRKIKQLESQLHIADHLGRDVYNIYGALLHYAYFDQYTMALIRSNVNKDSIKELIKDIQTIIKQSFKTSKNEILDIRNLTLISLMTLRIRIRLGVYESCELFTTFQKILKRLPRQLVQQFNTRYFARRRDSKKIDELKNTDEYKGMTKKFITLKLEKFYNLMRLYQINVNRLFIIEDRTQKGFTDFLQKIEGVIPINEKTALLDGLHERLNDGIGKYLQISAGLPKNEDLKKNSIKTLFSFVISYYYNVLKDTYAPATCREIAVRSMKMTNPTKEQMLNSKELTFLESDLFKRDAKVLNPFFQGIISLVMGEDDERVVVEPVMTALDVDYRRGNKKEMREKTIDQFVEAISLAELDLLEQIFDVVPCDRERMSSNLGKIYLETAEKYPASLKQRINRIERIQPTDSEIEKLRKAVTDKYYRILLKAVEFHSDRPSPAQYLKKTQEEEQAFINAAKVQEEMHAVYNISYLITHWKSETDKTVIGLCLGSGEKTQPPEKFRDFSRSEVSTIKDYFNGEHLGEVDKHYKTLVENIGPNYLKAPRYYSKIEYMLLYSAKHQLAEFRNPGKSYPRLHERLSAVSGKK